MEHYGHKLDLCDCPDGFPTSTLMFGPSYRLPLEGLVPEESVPVTLGPTGSPLFLAKEVDVSLNQNLAACLI